jgi:hypothetical protein
MYVAMRSFELFELAKRLRKNEPMLT